MRAMVKALDVVSDLCDCKDYTICRLRTEINFFKMQKSGLVHLTHSNAKRLEC